MCSSSRHIASPAEAGVYAVVTRTVRAGQVVDRAMRLAVSPTISRLLARGESAATRALHTSVTRAMILMSWPFYLTLAIMGPAILGLFGPGFESGAVPLVILSGAMMVASSAGMLQSIILQGGNSSWQVANKSVVLAASVSLNLLLVPVLGIIGAAMTWAFVTLLDTAIAALAGAPPDGRGHASESSPPRDGHRRWSSSGPASASSAWCSARR